MARWIKVVLFVGIVLVAGLAVLWVELAPIAANLASRMTGRTVAIGTLRITPGRWVGIELRDASLANLPGGTRPEMATVGRVAGELSLWPLLHGVVVARAVAVERGDILLEHVDGRPNWRNGPKSAPKPGHGRKGFPTLLDAKFQGEVTFRTSGGTPLVTRLDGVTIEAASPGAPARVAGPGAYHDAPIVLDLKLGSYDQLHDANVPFPTDITMTSGDTVLHFVGTMTDPLNVDGATGQFSLVAPTPAALEKISGAGSSPAPASRIEGALEHNDDFWKLQQAKGALGQAVIEDGTLQFQEGDTATKAPDKIGVDLRFVDIDVDRLMSSFKGGGGSSEPSPLAPDADPNPQLVVSLSAANLTYGKFKLAQPKLAGSVEPKSVKLSSASFGVFGGQVRLDGQVRPTEDGKSGTVSTTLAAIGMEVAQLRQLLGAGNLPLTGRIDVHAVADGTGATQQAALEAGRASVVATMQGGSVPLKWVQLASTDVAGLVQSSKTMTPLSCLLAVAEIRGGVAHLSPVRLRSAQGTIVAGGQVDLLRDTLDVVVSSEARTTGVLALDVPMRVSGKLDDPSVAPAGQGGTGRASAVATPLREYVQRSACAR